MAHYGIKVKQRDEGIKEFAGGVAGLNPKQGGAMALNNGAHRAKRTTYQAHEKYHLLRIFLYTAVQWDYIISNV